MGQYEDWTFCKHRIPLAPRFIEGLKKAQSKQPVQRFFNSEQQETLATIALVGRHAETVETVNRLSLPQDPSMNRGVNEMYNS
jgi:hypothetical protein